MLFQPDNFNLRLPSHILKFDFISPQLWLALTLFGEARGCSEMVKNYVALTILTRRDIAVWYGNTIRDVVLKDFQFSCFNPNDLNFQKIQDPFRYEKDYLFNECVSISGILLNVFDNPNNRYCLNFTPTHYYSGKLSPDWSDKYQFLKEIEDFKFYRAVKL